MRSRFGWLLLVVMLLWSAPAKALPDLQIGLLWGTEENDNCVTQVHYILQILNFGDEPSGPFSMHVIFDAPELPAIEDIGLYNGVSHLVEEPIEVNGMYQIELWWKEDGGVPTGDWTSWMHIDTYDDVAEEDEENNSDGPIYLHTLNISCEPPNLVLETLGVKLQESTVKFNILATNVEDVDVPETFRLDLFVNKDSQPGYYEEGDYSLEIEGIGGGETVEWQIDWEIPTEDGVYPIYGVLDGWNTVFELSEADNILGPYTLVVCEECPDCVDGEPVDGPCKCGGEGVGTGYCCDGVHIEKDCSSLVEEASPEIVEEVVVEVTEEVISTPEAGFEVLSADVADDIPAAVDVAGEVIPEPETKKKDSGCAVGAVAGLGGWWLLGLLGLLVAIRRRES
jgi:MYXO-CTERM domain-containing protein